MAKGGGKVRVKRAFLKANEQVKPAGPSKVGAVQWYQGRREAKSVLVNERELKPAGPSKVGAVQWYQGRKEAKSVLVSEREGKGHCWSLLKTETVQQRQRRSGCKRGGRGQV